MSSAWFLILVIATGQPIALGEPTEAACLADLKRVHAGDIHTVTLDNGLVLPVMRGIECVTREEFEARKEGGI